MSNNKNREDYLFDKSSYKISQKLLEDIKEFINENYEINSEDSLMNLVSPTILNSEQISFKTKHKPELAQVPSFLKSKRSLKDIQIGETFQEMLVRLINSSGKTDPEIYKAVNIDRRLFSKIISDKYYKPSKKTAISLAISLKLTLDETKDLLEKAGFALSRSQKFDLIVEYFIIEGNYDIYEINSALYEITQQSLGANDRV